MITTSPEVRSCDQGPRRDRALPQETLCVPVPSMRRIQTELDAGCFDACAVDSPMLDRVRERARPFRISPSPEKPVCADNTPCLYLDGRAFQHSLPAAAGPRHFRRVDPIARIRPQRSCAARVDERIVVLPHLDILGASAGGGLAPRRARPIPLYLQKTPRCSGSFPGDPAFPLPKADRKSLSASRSRSSASPRDQLQRTAVYRKLPKPARSTNALIRISSTSTSPASTRCACAAYLTSLPARITRPIQRRRSAQLRTAT